MTLSAKGDANGCRDTERREEHKPRANGNEEKWEVGVLANYMYVESCVSRG